MLLMMVCAKETGRVWMFKKETKRETEERRRMLRVFALSFKDTSRV